MSTFDKRTKPWGGAMLFLSAKDRLSVRYPVAEPEQGTPALAIIRCQSEWHGARPPLPPSVTSQRAGHWYLPPQ